MKVDIYSRETMEKLLKEKYSGEPEDPTGYSEAEFERYLKNNADSDKVAVISFYDPPSKNGFFIPPVDYSGKIDRVFQIALHDIDIEILSDFDLTFDTYFTEADKLAEFVYAAKYDGTDIICQCEYGQSRSAGCAAAIRQHFDGDGIEVFADYRYYPNQLIYNKMLAALEKYKKLATGNPYYYASNNIKAKIDEAGSDDELVSSLCTMSKKECGQTKERIENFLSSKNLLCRSWWDAINGFLGIGNKFDYISVRMDVTDIRNYIYEGHTAPVTLIYEYKYSVEKIKIMLWLKCVERDMGLYKYVPKNPARKYGVEMYMPNRRIHFDYCGILGFDILATMIWDKEKKQIILVPLIIFF